MPICDELLPHLVAATARRRGDLVFPAADGRVMPDNVKLAPILHRALKRAEIVIGYDFVCRRKGCRYEDRHDAMAEARCPKCNMRLWVKPVPKPVRFHDLRATFATHLHERRVTSMATVRGETRYPSLASSPAIRFSPQVGLSRYIRRTKALAAHSCTSCPRPRATSRRRCAPTCWRRGYPAWSRSPRAREQPDEARDSSAPSTACVRAIEKHIKADYTQLNQMHLR